MLTRRDLIKMGLMGCGGYMVLRSGGRVGKVSAFFSDELRSPTLTPFMDRLPFPSECAELSSRVLKK